MLYILCFLHTLIIAITTEYVILDESGARIGLFQYNSRLVKRDIENPTQRKVIVQDNHKYYTSTVVANSSVWIELNPALSKLDMDDKDTIHEGLSETFRYAYNIRLPFVFPYYGLPLTTITPTTGGFIFVGELIHNQLTETQYIAPLMAEFNPSLSNDSAVYYYMTGTKAIVQWDNVYTHSQYDKTSDDNKPYTFQVQLYINGDIIFAYKNVHNASDIDNTYHYVRAGIAEAYYEVDKSHGVGFTVTYIHQYHKIDIDLKHIVNDNEVKLTLVKTCMTAKSCAGCATIETNFNCSWCPDLQQCSDGVGRWQQKWNDAKCSDDSVVITKSEKCPNESEDNLPPKDESGFYEVVLCQESKTMIVCAGNDKLIIDSAEFNRKNYFGSFCEGSTTRKGRGSKCAYDKNLVKETISKKCDDKTKCFIHAAQSFFGTDPCPGVDKTLNIYYKCSGSTSMGMKVFTGFIVVVVVVLLLGFTGWVTYAYRHPTTPSGLWLIKYGRFWKSSSWYKEDTTESGI